MTKDRNYYRTLDSTLLEEEVKYGIDVDWMELAVALAERMHKIRIEVMDELAEQYCPHCDREL